MCFQCQLALPNCWAVPMENYFHIIYFFLWNVRPRRAALCVSLTLVLLSTPRFLLCYRLQVMYAKCMSRWMDEWMSEYPSLSQLFMTLKIGRYLLCEAAMEETWPMWRPDSFYMRGRRGKRYGDVSRLSGSREQQGTVANNVMRFLFLLTRGCLANFCKGQPDSKYFQPCKWWGLAKLLKFSVIMQNQPQIIPQWMGVAVFQYNLIYGQWNLNFISFILFLISPTIQNVKSFLGSWDLVHGL